MKVHLSYMLSLIEGFTQTSDGSEFDEFAILSGTDKLSYDAARWFFFFC